MSRDKSPHQQRVEMFMEKAGQAVPSKPILPDFPTRRLRAKVILEEALEAIEGLGFEAIKKPWSEDWDVQEAYIPDLLKIVDGCADLSVVSVGTLSACGVADVDVMVEVDKNNLEKFGPGGYRRPEDGKWIKPPDHKPPDIKRILEDQAR